MGTTPRQRRYRNVSLLAAAAFVAIGVINISGSAAWLRHIFLPSVALEDALLSPAPGDSSTQVSGLLQELARLKSVDDENSALREMLNFQSRVKHRFLAANVLYYDPFNPSVVYIDKGSRDGVREGQPVTAGEGHLIGKTASVSTASSAFELLTNETSRIAAASLFNATTTGIVRGDINQNLIMEYVDSNQKIEVGELIVTSGLEPLIPNGLVIGTVRKVLRDTNELFAQANVEPSIRQDRIRVVSILLLP